MLAFVGVLGLVLAVAELLGVPLAWGRRMVGREAL
jgi:hypothetical protein